MAQPIADGSSSGAHAPTLLAQLQALTQPSLGLPTPYLHPYAPLPGSHGPAGWKGKERAVTADSVQAQLEIVRAMRTSVEQAKAQLVKREGDWGKLARALKEVISHQNVLVPLASGLDPVYLAAGSGPLLPSSRIALAPVELLSALARAQSLQAYQEDSQFGLLKVTLTLAGNCFVVDIDLETDAAADDDEAPGTSNSQPTPRADAAAATERSESRGLVRLSKIAVSYVTPGGGMEASEYIADVLRSAVEGYLEEWNSVVEGLVSRGERGKRLEKCIRRIEGLLVELKALDGPLPTERNEQAEEAAFAGLAGVAKRLQGLKIDTLDIYPELQATVCPSFRLYPSDEAGPSIPNPQLRIRPSRPHEVVPFCGSRRKETVDEPLASDQPTKWIIEVVPEAGADGLVVRRSWLGGPAAPSNQWDGGVKVEHLLYKHSDALGTLTGPQLSPFPYEATFVHEPAAKSGHKPLAQHWSMPSPGPDGYVVGRIGMPDSEESLEQTLRALKRQVHLNRLFLGVFNASALATTSAMATDGEEDDEMEDLLAAPTAVPITMTQIHNGFELDSPLPYSDQPGATLRLNLSPESGAGEISVEPLLAEGMDDAALGTLREATAHLDFEDLVEIYQVAEAAAAEASGASHA